MPQNQREVPRTPTYKPAFLFTGAGAPLGKCIVKDISECGAKLVFSTKEELPNSLLLTIGMDRRQCRLVWRRDQELGVEFAATRT